jgi:hypothetical protein
VEKKTRLRIFCDAGRRRSQEDGRGGSGAPAAVGFQSEGAASCDNSGCIGPTVPRESVLVRRTGDCKGTRTKAPPLTSVREPRHFAVSCTAGQEGGGLTAEGGAPVAAAARTADASTRSRAGRAGRAATVSSGAYSGSQAVRPQGFVAPGDAGRRAAPRGSAVRRVRHRQHDLHV